MSLATLFALLAMGTHMTLGLLVFFRAPGNPVNQHFSFILALFFWWSTGELLLLHASPSPFLIPFLLTPILCLPFFFARFTAIFPRPVQESLFLKPGWTRWLLFVPVLISVFVLWYGTLFSTAEAFELGIRFRFGKLEYLVKGIVAGYLLLALHTLSIARSRPNGNFLEKRIQYTFAALVLPAAGGALFLLLSRFFFGLPGQTIYVFGIFPALGVIMAALLGYAILKYQLMDINMIFSIGLVYTLMTALLVGGLEIFQNLLQNYLEITGTMATVFSTLLLAGAFSPMKDLVGRLVDYLFGRQAFDTATVLKHLLQAMRQGQTPAEVINRLLRELQPVIGFSSSAVFLPPAPPVQFPRSEQATPALPRSWKFFTATEEIDAALEAARDEHDPDEQIFQRWREQGYLLAFPIPWNLLPSGGLFLSPKNGRFPFTDQERSLVSSLCHELQPILENLTMVQALLSRDRATRDVEWARNLYKQIQARTDVTRMGYCSIRFFSSLAESIKGDFIDLRPEATPPTISVFDAFHQGIPAALTLYIVRTALRAAPGKGGLLAAHRILAEFTDPPLRTALTHIEVLSDSVRVTSAGNPLPIIITQGLEPETCGHRGTPLGMSGDLDAQIQEFSLNNRQVLVICTNGVPKAFGDEEGIGFKQFLARIGSSLDALHESLKQELQSRTGKAGFPDDISYVLIQGPAT